MKDDLDDIDLHAWQAPPPPRNLADAVIARINAAGEAIAVETHRRGRRRFAIAGGGLAAALAASVAVWLGLHGPAPTDEMIGSDAPRHVEIGGIVADLGPGAMIRTHRVGDTLNVVQSGTATWNVSARDHLVIAAGSSTSIDATGASLRVEATMNLTDVRIVSGAALTAAAVALATVVVYEGHAKVTSSNGQSVVVQPDNLAKIDRDLVTLTQALQRPKYPPIAPRAGGDLAITAGESVVIHSESGEVTVEIHSSCNAEVKLMYAMPEHLHRGPVPEPLQLAGTDSVDGKTSTYRLGAHGYDYTSTCVDKPAIGGTIVVDRNDGHTSIGVTNARVYGGQEMFSIDPSRVRVLGDVVAGTSVTVGATPVVVNPPDAVSDSTTFAADVPVDADHPVGTVRVDNALGTHFYVYHMAETLAMPCEEWAPSRKQARLREAKGDYAGALWLLEMSECKLDRQGFTQAFTFACKAGDLPKAREYWRKLPDELHDRLADVCISNHITRDDLDASAISTGACDPKTDPPVVADDGADHHVLTKDERATAFANLEKRYWCKPETNTLLTAFMSACDARNIWRARTYWHLLTPEARNRLVDHCTANHITRDELGDEAPPPCNADLELNEGNDASARGEQSAVVFYENAYRCKPTPRTLMLTFTAACNAVDAAKARDYWRLMTPDQQNKLVVTCVRNNITRAQLDASSSACDADAEVDAGNTATARGEHALALKHYETAYHCKADAHTVMLAFMSSCNVESIPKARTYWHLLSRDNQNRLAIMCTRNGITRAQLDAP